MDRIFVSVGSNIEPEKNIVKAFDLLNNKVRIKAVSRHYYTPPLGTEGNRFINAVWEIDTLIDPEKLKYEILRSVETDAGRVRSEDKYAPREIDLDLIIYGNVVINRDYLVLPDSDILKRNFIAFPLYELCENLVIPGYNRSLKTVICNLDSSGMEYCEKVTGILRRRLLNES